MREIKFRAWDKKKKKMLYQDDCDFDGVGCDGDIITTYHEDDGEIIKEWYDNNFEVELMQYTGLKDKNGKEIYGEDILKQVYVVNLGHRRTDEIHLWIVKFGISPLGTGFYLKHTGSDGVKPLDVEEFKNYKIVEVIGNIYENPELIK